MSAFAAARPSSAAAIGFAAALVASGNALQLFFGTSPTTISWVAAAAGIAVAALALAFARRAGLSLRELGLRGGSPALAAAIGALCGIAVVVPALLLLRFPPLLGEPVSYAPVAALSGRALALRLFVFMPLDTVLPEEIAFRGVLLALLLRRARVVPAAALSAAAFALWHTAIIGATLARTNLVAEPLFASLGLAGAFAAVFAGGVAFALLRVATRHLVAPAALHWTFDAALLAGLWALSR